MNMAGDPFTFTGDQIKKWCYNFDQYHDLLKNRSAAEAIHILWLILGNVKIEEILDLALKNLTGRLREIGQATATEPKSLLTELQPFCASMSVGKCAKLVHGVFMIHSIAQIPESSELQNSLCKQIVEWIKAADESLFISLKCLQIEGRIAHILKECKKVYTSLELSSLIKDVTLLDDKVLLLEIKLLESKLHDALADVPRALATLETLKQLSKETGSNVMREAICLHEGILHVEEKPLYAFKCFREAFNCRGCHGPYSFKCMALSKIMAQKYGYVGKLVADFEREEVALQAIADSHLDYSLKEFNSAIEKYKLAEDPTFMRCHPVMFDTVLEGNLVKIIVKSLKLMDADFVIHKLALSVGVSNEEVKKKLEQLIQNKKIAGSITHRRLYIDATVYARFAGFKFGMDFDYESDNFFNEAECCLLTDQRVYSILPVRNQGKTKACGAFAMVDLLFSSQFLETPLSIICKGSEQQLIDMVHQIFPREGEVVTEYGVGRPFENTYEYVERYGLLDEDILPFLGTCMTATDAPSRNLRTTYIEKLKENGVQTMPLGFETLHHPDEVLLALTYGPPVLSVIRVLPSFRQFFGAKGAVYSQSHEEIKKIREAMKSGIKLSYGYHAILLVGFGVEKCTKEPYYIAKSSYGVEWGYKGYFKLRRHLCLAFFTVKGCRRVTNTGGMEIKKVYERRPKQKVNVGSKS